MDRKIKKVHDDIKSLKIQGATAVARETIRALISYVPRVEAGSYGAWNKKIRQAADYLLIPRPTEPLAQNGARFVFRKLAKKIPKSVVGGQQAFEELGERFLEMMDEAEEKILKHGPRVIGEGDNVMTHCHSSLAEHILITAKKKAQKKFKVYNTETRPLFQGRITSKNLIAAGISDTMVVDSSAGFLISHFSGRDTMMDKIILGADAILPDGSVINKIGSFSVASAARHEKTPVYIASTLLKFHPSSWIRIERRDPKEIWRGAPKKLKIINFAFDLVPSGWIKGIITEFGIIEPSEVMSKIKKHYPWMIEE